MPDELCRVVSTPNSEPRVIPDGAVEAHLMHLDVACTQLPMPPATSEWLKTDNVRGGTTDSGVKAVTKRAGSLAIDPKDAPLSAMVRRGTAPLSGAGSVRGRSDLANMAHMVQLCTRGRPLDVALAEMRATRKSIENGILPPSGAFRVTKAVAAALTLAVPPIARGEATRPVLPA